MGNVLHVSVNKYSTALSDPLYQYDYGQKIVIDDVELPQAYEVHFSNSEFGNSTTSIGDNTGVVIPDTYLTTGKDVYAWLFLHEGANDGETVYKIVVPVRKRARITETTPTPVQQDVITQTIAALDTAVSSADDDALEAEGYAVGTQNGEPVASGSPYYHNNAKYYAEQASGDAQMLIDDAAGVGVTDKTWSANKLAGSFAAKAPTTSPVFTERISMGRIAGSTAGRYSVALGNNVVASGEGSSAEGLNTTASGTGASVRGSGGIVTGQYADASGNGTIANHKSQHVVGEFNVADTSAAAATARGNYAEIVGNGTNANARGNARVLEWNGDEHLRGDLYIGANADGTGGSKVLSSILKGASNGIAELDENGKVPSSQLPSYVDDVVEYSSLSVFPATGESGKIYVALDTNKTYRWGGTEYVSISSDLALGETSSTAYRGDRGKIAYDHAADSGKVSSASATGLYKIGITAEGHVASVAAVQKSDITALGIQETISVATTTETQAIITEYGVSA